ncbi:MAG: glycoside hydrolase family 2 TIM barrel-domain containing protein [Armatimonadota bacterium]|nr:glycoside hydrolase family 2 TIM barrel-domain containing protein [Armatimonadota bacterium]
MDVPIRPPRPEHPRPDFHRGLRPGVDWLNLNGTWDFEFDPDNAGLADGWFEPPEVALSRRIVVPFAWESHLAWGTEAQAGNQSWFSREVYRDPASVTVENYREAPRHTIGWYRRGFELPADWHDRRVFLNVEAADWELRAWVNGAAVGQAESGYLPVSFDVTDALVEGENTLVIRVHDPQEESRKPLGKQVPSWYTPTSGIWQTVWLEPRARAHILAAPVLPSLAEERATVLVEVAGDDESSLSVAAELRASTGAAAAHGEPVPVTDGRGRLELPVPDAIPWSPDAPHMYRLQVHLLREGQVVDTVHTQFGMRDVDVGPLGEDGPTYIRLNGEPVYLRGALDQSFTPEGVYAHASNADIRRDLLLARQAGLNFLRLHIKTPDPRYCYWADRVGVMLMCDMPNLGYDGYSQVGRERWERTAWGQIRRDFNHPSIIAWCLFNETWGLGGRDYAQMPQRQQWVRDCYERASELDPTRLVEDNSACLNDHVITDINSWHFYINDYQEARAHIEEVVERTCPGSDFNYVPGRTQGDEPLLCSEYGGISARMGDLDVSWCLLLLTNELRRHEEICGYVYTELTDIEWEHNGLYNYDRSPKQFGYDPAMILGESFVGFDGPPGSTVEPGAEVSIPLFLRPSARAEKLAGRLRWSATFIDRLCRERVIIRPRGLDDFDAESASLTLTVPDEPGLTRVQAFLHDTLGRPVAWNLRVLESVTELPPTGTGGAMVLTALPGDCQAHFEGDVERAEVGGEVHLLAGQGDGTAQWRFALPDEVEPGQICALTLMAELSSARPGAPQTDEDRWPSLVEIAFGEQTVRRVVLPDQPADARGALSHMHGLLGRYGQIVTARLSGDRARAAVSEGGIGVRLTVSDSGADRGGLTIYGSRAGRYPCDVTLQVDCLHGI